MSDHDNRTEEKAALEEEQRAAQIASCESILETLDLENGDYATLSKAVEDIVGLNITDIDKFPREIVEKFHHLVRRARALEKQTSTDTVKTAQSESDDRTTTESVPPDDAGDNASTAEAGDEKTQESPPKRGFSQEEIDKESVRRIAAENAAKDKDYRDNEEGFVQTITQLQQDIADKKRLSLILGVSRSDKRGAIAQAYARYTANLNRYIGLYQPLKNYDFSVKSDGYDHRKYRELYDTGEALFKSLNAAFDRLKKGEDPLVDVPNGQSAEQENTESIDPAVKKIREMLSSLANSQLSSINEMTMAIWEFIRHDALKTAQGGQPYQADCRTLLTINTTLRKDPSQLTPTFIANEVASFHTIEMKNAFQAVAQRELEQKTKQAEKEFSVMESQLRRESGKGFSGILQVLESEKSTNLAATISTLRTAISELTSQLDSATYQELLADWNKEQIGNKLSDVPFKDALAQAVVVEVTKRKKIKGASEAANAFSGSNWETAQDVAYSRRAENPLFDELSSGMRDLQAQFLVEGKTGYWNTTPQGRKISGPRVSIPGEKSFFDSIADTSLKVKLKELFSAWATEQQVGWEEEIDQLREKVRSDLKDQLLTVIPAYAKRVETIDGIASVFDQPKRTLLVEQVSQRIHAAVDSTTSALTLQELSGTVIQRQLDNLAKDARFNPDNVLSRPEQQLHYPNERGSQQSLGYSTEIIRVLEGTQATLQREIDGIMRSINFIAAEKNASQNSDVTFLELSDFHPISYSSEPAETKQQAPLKNYQSCVEAILLARLKGLEDNLQANSGTARRKERQAKLHLPDSAYLRVSSDANTELLAKAVTEAVASLISLGYPPEQVRKCAENLKLPKGHEALVQLTSSVLMRPDATVDFLDPNLFVELNADSAEGSTEYVRRGFFNTDNLGKSFEFDRADAQRRIELLNALFDQTTTHYDLSGFVDNQRSSMGDRLERSSILNPREFQYNWIKLRIGTCLTDAEKDSLRILASQPKTNTDVLKRAIELKLQHSEMLKQRVIEMNSFASEIVDKAVTNPEKFLREIGMEAGADFDKLTPADWYSILFTIIRGRYDEGEKKPYVVRKSSPPSLYQSPGELEAALQYGIRLREAVPTTET